MAGGQKQWWHFTLLAGALLALVVGTNFARELYNNHRIDAEIAALKQKEAQLMATQQDLLRLKEELGSKDVLEKEARLKMGLMKPGETVVIIPEEEIAKTPEPVQEESAPERNKAKSWWNLFFR